MFLFVGFMVSAVLARWLDPTVPEYIGLPTLWLVVGAIRTWRLREPGSPSPFRTIAVQAVLAAGFGFGMFRWGW